MAKVNTFNKQHPLYQEDLDYILRTPEIDKLKGKTILITGATGLIGTCLIDALMKYNKEGGACINIYAVGRNKEKAAVRFGEYYGNKLFKFIEQDIRFPLQLNTPVDIIVPLASNTHPLAYSQYPIETIEINVKGAEYALQKAEKDKATILYPSTVEVYGNARNGDVFTEDYTGSLNLSTSRSCYTESKRLSEALCQSYIAEKQSKVKIVRLSRVFGPTMQMSDTKASSQFIIKSLCGEDIILKSSGNQFFSYIYVAEAVAAMIFVLLHGGNGVAYNIANDNCNVHLKDFANECANLIGTKVVYEIASDIEKAGFSIANNAILNTEKLKVMGFTPNYDIHEAIRRTILILNNK